MKLYIVTLQNYKDYYVVASDCNKAYEKVKEILDREDLFFEREKQLKSIELLGETYYESEEVFIQLD